MHTNKAIASAHEANICRKGVVDAPSPPWEEKQKRLHAGSEAAIRRPYYLSRKSKNVKRNGVTILWDSKD